MYLTPDNIRYWASHLHSSADIQQRVIHFGPGAENDLLIEVPLGEIDPRATIVVTVGLDEFRMNSAAADSDPRIGLWDGTSNNTQIIHDVDNYNLPPCQVIDSTAQDGKLVPTDTPFPSVVKLTFIPFYRYAACETAQHGGYINTGTFRSQLDTTKPLFLIVLRQHGSEEMFFRYFRVETF